MDILIYLIIGLAFLFIFLHFFSNERKLAQRFKNIKRQNYSSLKDANTVHVYGRTKLTKELLSPLTQNNCCYYESIVYETNRFGKDDVIKNEADWSILKKEIQSANFLLEVDMNPIFIINSSPEVLIKKTVDTHSEQLLSKSEYESYWPNIKNFLEKHGFRVSNIYDKNEKRIKESLIGDNEPMAVIGCGKWVKTAEYPELLEIVKQDDIYVISASDKSPLILTNQNSLLWG